MTEIISALRTYDVRFPTSRHLDGSDAMHPAPDYSAAYAILRTSGGEEGYGLAFTVGRGNEVQVAAIEAMAPLVVGLPVRDVLADMGGFTTRLVQDPSLRWLGPAKGVIQMAAGAVVNAAWDLAARRAGMPLWKLLADLTPEQVVSLVDFRYLRDALTPEEALDILRRARPGRVERERRLLAEGYPAYTSTPGWLGYDDAKLVRLCREAVADGFGLIKVKVGARLEDDTRRMRLARETVGPDLPIAVDANQAWGVDEAIGWMHALAPFRPHWIEEPTSPDDVLGHATIRAAIHPIRVATGEHVQNAVVFKQLLRAAGGGRRRPAAARLGGRLPVPRRSGVDPDAGRPGAAGAVTSGGPVGGEFDRMAALVTGGGSGIGLATARLLAQRGARVAVLDVDPAPATPLVALRGDVTDDGSVRAAVDAAAGGLGGLDVLVNNAGISAVGTVADNPDDEWRRVLDVNVLGMVRVNRAALPYLRRSANAAIVNTCSIAATAGLPLRALYSASKGAVLALTLAMAADHVAEGIRVCCVNPGTADTPWVRRLLDAAADPAAELAALEARQPTGRLVSAAEVAHAIAYLASPLAGATTGTALAVDGGMAGLRLRPRAR